MSHEPGRERHMTYRCDRCARGDVPLHYYREFDHNLCTECAEDLQHEQDKLDDK